MAYINSEYYYNSYGGAETSDDINILFERASEIIDILTDNAIQKNGGLINFLSSISNKIKLAVAAQTDYLNRNGGLSFLDSFVKKYAKGRLPTQLTPMKQQL